MRCENIQTSGDILKDKIRKILKEIEKERKEVREALFTFLRTKTSERIIGRTEGIIDGLDRAEDLIKKLLAGC